MSFLNLLHNSPEYVLPANADQVINDVKIQLESIRGVLKAFLDQCTKSSFAPTFLTSLSGASLKKLSVAVSKEMKSTLGAANIWANVESELNKASNLVDSDAEFKAYLSGLVAGFSQMQQAADSMPGLWATVLMAGVQFQLIQV